MDAEGSGGGRAHDEAARWLEIAERLLRVRDFVGCKRFAERAMEADPLLSGGAAEQLIAAANVILASQRRVNNQINWYAVLQLDPTCPTHRQLRAVRRQYSRLARLVHPGRDHLEGIEFAAKLVSDAWTVLSDPSKKSLFDAELDSTTAASAPSPDRPPTFWTACSSCYCLHQYVSDYEGKRLWCPRCRRAFDAAPLQADPPIVPGTDTYYCSWGFFPLGFPSGISADEPGVKTNLFQPMFPMSPFPQPQSTDQKEAANAMASRAVETTPTANKESVAKSVPSEGKSVSPKKKKSVVSKKKYANKVKSNSRKRTAVPEGRTRSSERIRSKLADRKAEV